ncbi:phosphodiester glycosidase family protein [Streptomyces sp. CT34]|uniref:phosphodiester glycosidase family protein n=1 Tax=Streptomyces sp. CT34 TaxID=1553907 RepID=UPI000A6DD049|nr:phosphodiester glycosidase family protein [Streptomyces sp. CT34]
MESKKARRAWAGASIAVVMAVAAASGANGTAQAGSPAGARWLTTSTQKPAPGVQVRTMTRQDPTAAPSWTVTVQAPAAGRLTGAATWSEVGSKSWADTTARRLTTSGFRPRVAPVRWPGYTDTPNGVMGLRVRVGSYATRAAARSAAGSIAAAGFHTAVVWTGYDADQPADGEVVHVAVVDPRAFAGSVQATHDGKVTQRETTSSVAAKLRSLVGINGGFFVTADSDGVQGTQSGLGAYGGRLESLSAGARAALVLQDGGRHDRVADITTTVTARAGRATYQVQGVNRLPGTVRDCGRPGASPSDLPWQDVTCHEPNDLVLLTPEFGAALPTGPGTQVVIDAAGRVVSVGARGGSVPAHGAVLQGIGAAGNWLTAHARAGHPIRITQDIRDTTGRRIPLGPHDSVVSAAPTLVRGGRISIDAATEGVVDPADLSFGYTWANVRQPRTMAGIDARGRLLLVTVDGRRKGGSEGFTLAEGAAFMRSLGAVQALNLDGGGSTAMAVNGRLVNTPSDVTGERAVGDTIQVVPSRQH